jgi:LuxR family maltose regulon positive regulatory protein
VRAFLEEGVQLQQLLQEEYQANHGTALLRDGKSNDNASHKPNQERAFLQSLLQASGVDTVEAARHEGSLPEALTSREREILSYLAAGDSNREMAERIFVSENTVKFHLKNIYSKLGVGTRIQAISAARTLGVIR